MDKFERLAHDADFAVAILGNPATSDFELVDLSGSMPHNIRNGTARGLFFLGAAGLVQGVPQTALSEPLDHAAIGVLATAYLAHLEKRLNESLEIALLMQIHGLPDARAN